MSTPHGVPAWPYATPARYAASRTSPSRPGVETRQVLLGLGATCLIVAFSAGTALVWSSLGTSGQIAVMAAMTALLLAGAARTRRLPATAEALGAVGLTACVVDAIAARTLHLSVATGIATHTYAAGAALAVTAVAAALAKLNPRLVCPPLAYTGGALAAAVAAVNPTAPGHGPYLAPIGVAVALGMDLVLRHRHPGASPARIVNALGASIVTVIGFIAALTALEHHNLAGLWGAALPIGLFVLPSATGSTNQENDDVTAGCAGVTAAVMALAAGPFIGTDARTVAAIGLPLLGIGLLAPSRTGWARRTQITLSIQALPGVVAWASLAGRTQRFGYVDLTLAVAALVVAYVWPTARDNVTPVRVAAQLTAAVLAGVGAGVILSLHGVTTPEAYVVTPAGLLLATGADLLIRNRAMPSAVLAPGLFVGLFPTLTMALYGEHGRQACLLVVATVIVAAAAELRLSTPLVAGSAIIGLVSLRVVGPELALVPHWVVWAAAGAILLTLGATWEARLQDVRRVRDAVAPRIAALR